MLSKGLEAEQIILVAKHSSQADELNRVFNWLVWACYTWWDATKMPPEYKALK